jgi:hypothetical protein
MAARLRAVPSMKQQSEKDGHNQAGAGASENPGASTLISIELHSAGLIMLKPPAMPITLLREAGFQQRKAQPIPAGLGSPFASRGRRRLVSFLIPLR